MSQFAQAEALGMKPCKQDFGRLLICYLILDMFFCSGGADLTPTEIDCLEGKLQQKLESRCCS